MGIHRCWYLENAPGNKVKWKTTLAAEKQLVIFARQLAPMDPC